MRFLPITFLTILLLSACTPPEDAVVRENTAPDRAEAPASPYGFNKEALLAAAAASPTRWPGGARAAVVLTYDDGLPCQLDHAWPLLDSLGLKATFYLNASAPTLPDRLDDWRALAAAGHELGNHTLYHPCMRTRPGRDDYDWVRDEHNLNNYSHDQIKGEIWIANTFLRAIDGRPERTFAYTCCDYMAGPDDEPFYDGIRDIFPAARNEGPNPETLDGADLMLLPSVSVGGFSAAQMIETVEDARAKGTVATLMFHGIDCGNLRVTEADHRAFLDYLVAHPEDYWVGTFHELATILGAE